MIKYTILQGNVCYNIKVQHIVQYHILPDLSDHATLDGEQFQLNVITVQNCVTFLLGFLQILPWNIKSILKKKKFH